MARRRLILLTFALCLLAAALPAAASAQALNDGLPSPDARTGLGAGEFDAEIATLGMGQVGFFDKRTSPFWDANSMSTNVGLAIGSANSDIAFTSDADGRPHVIHGNWKGFQIYDISDPTNPVLRTAALCPGGQGDVTVHGTLMFTSVEEGRGGLDCTVVATPNNQLDPNRARGVRIWDISDLDNPVQLAVVQTCRGSHTHRLVEDPTDDTVVYIYNNGTSVFRHPGEAGLSCRDHPLTQEGVFDPTINRWQIEIIEVPLANPASARVIRNWRPFEGEDGRLNGLNNTLPGTSHPCASDDVGSCTPAGSAYSPLPNTNSCHDITVYPEIGLAAGACQGDGLLIDISHPANPRRIDAVSDPNFSYWHSANFNNDGTKVMFTDEWGGGTGARCTADHRLSWGANALFDIVDTAAGKRLEFANYFKMPAPQATTENCVAHQANIVPVPGRDILVQAWYQGGISMFDWTDTANPVEIGYWDRGPIRGDAMVLGGHWSGYWFNGNVYGAEIARGLDVLDLTPTAQLSANEIAAAKTVQLDEHNAMSMRRITWEPSFPVVRAHRDQLDRAGGLTPQERKRVDEALDRAERLQSGPQKRAAVANLEATANSLSRDDQQALAEALRDLAASLR